MNEVYTVCVWTAMPVTRPVCLSLPFLELRLMEKRISKDTAPFQWALTLYPTPWEILCVHRVV